MENNNTTITRKFPISSVTIFFLMPVVFFWAVSLFRLPDIPGVYYDEARNIAPVFYWYSGTPLNGRNAHDNLPWTGINTKRVRVPLMINFYRGFTESYVLFPFFKLFGLNTGVMRYFSVTAAFAAAILMAAAIYDIFGIGAAWFFVFLVLTNAPFILHGRIGIWGSQSILWLATAAVFRCFSLYRTTARALWLYLGFFICGIAAYTHQIFLILMLGMIIMEMIFIRKNLSFKGSLICAAAFVAGFSPFLTSNIFNGFKQTGAIISMMSDHFFSSGGDKFTLVGNLTLRFHQLTGLFDGSVIHGGRAPGQWTLRMLCYLPLAVPPALLFRGVREELGSGKKYIYALIGLSAFYFVCVSFNFLGDSYYHLLNMIPLLLLVDAAIISAALKYLSSKKGLPAAVMTVLIAALIVAAAGAQGTAFFRYFSFHMRTGGYSIWACAPAQKELSKYLLENGYTEPFALDWGISYPVMALTSARVMPLEIPIYDGALLYLSNLKPSPVLINIAETNGEKTYSKDYRLAADRLGLRETDKRYFNDNLGNNVFYTFRLVKK